MFYCKYTIYLYNTLSLTQIVAAIICLGYFSNHLQAFSDEPPQILRIRSVRQLKPVSVIAENRWGHVVWCGLLARLELLKHTFIYVRQFVMLIYFHLPTRRVPRRPIDLYCQLLMHKLMIMCSRRADENA